MHYFISRHPGAIRWFEQQFPQQGIYLTHLHNPEIIQPHDIVMGTLPINLIAAVCARGARFYHLELEMPVHLRGQELSAQQLTELGVSLVEYFAIRPASDDQVLQLAEEREPY